MTYFEDGDIKVTLSDEGLRRAAQDNELLGSAARTYEITAAFSCVVIVVALVAMFVDTLARIL